MPEELLLIDKYKLALSDYDEKPLDSHAVRARGIMSAISHGTEINLYRGTSPFHNKRFDPDKRLFVADTEEISYPQYLGYEWFGEIIEVGSGVSGYKIGDRVHLPRPHTETQTFNPQQLEALGVAKALPDRIAPEQAVFLASISIALQALHDAQIKVGDHVLIFGAGILGLLTVQLARLNGASRIDVVDPVDTRREVATSLGATQALDPMNTDIGAAIKTDSPGADVAIEFSGQYPALHQAIRSVRMAGRVVAAGFYQGGASALNLGEEWHHNRVTMLSSTRAWGNPHRDYPLWDRLRLRETAIQLLVDKRLQLDKLLTHKISFVEAQKAYEMIDRGDEAVLKVALVY